MGITLVIVGGIVIVSVIAVIGDTMSKSKLARGAVNPDVLHRLESRVAELEQKVHEQDQKVQLLENDVAFANKLLEDKSAKL